MQQPLVLSLMDKAKEIAGSDYKLAKLLQPHTFSKGTC